jgi:hypothetical protein
MVEYPPVAKAIKGRKIPLFANANRGVAVRPGGLKFFLQKKISTVLYKNQTKSTITAIPVAFLLFAKMQTPRFYLR